VFKRLAGLVRDEDGAVRRAAVKALARIDRLDKNSLDTLVERLEDDDNDAVRRAAAIALGQVGRSDPAVLQALISELEDNPGVPLSAAKALGKIGSSDPAVLQVLIGQLESKRPDVRTFAISALKEIGISNPSVIEVLLNRLKGDKDPMVRATAAVTLGRASRPDSDIREALIARLESDESNLVRRSAAEALDEIDGDHATIEALSNHLRDEDAGVRSRAAKSLVELGSFSSDAFDVVVDLLKDGETARVPRIEAIKCLGKIGSSDAEVIKALLEQLHDRDSQIENEVIDALAKIGRFTPTVAKALLDKLRGPDKRVTSCITEVFSCLPWRVFSKDQIGEAVRIRLAEALKNRQDGHEVVQTEGGECLIAHWEALARLPE
jgi:HEAT repeat protein